MNSEFIFLLVLDLLLKGAGILIFATIVARILRRASAASQGVIWSTVLIVLALLPLTLLIAPQWACFTVVAGEARDLIASGGTAMSSISSGSTAVSGRAATISDWNWRAALAGAWLLGVIILLLRCAIGGVRLMKMAWACILPSEQILRISAETAGLYQLSGPARIHLSKTAAVPMTWGSRPATIILPEDALTWSHERLRVVLRHEYAHVCRRDSRFRLIAQLACALHWMNPLVWSAARKLRAIQEQATDDLVLGTGIDRITYADELIAMVQRVLQPRVGFDHALFMAQPSTLGTRLDSMLDEERDRKPMKLGLRLACLCVAMLSLAASAIAQVSGREPVKPSPETGKPSPQSAKSERFEDYPINITADSTSTSNGVMTAKGNVKLTYRALTITADSLQYDPRRKVVLAEGKVDVTQPNGDRTSGLQKSKVEYHLPSDKMRFEGATRTILKSAAPDTK